MPDSNIIQMKTGLETIEGFYYRQLTFYFIQVLLFPGYQIKLGEELYGWSNNTLFIIYFKLSPSLIAKKNF